jgi:quercetin dioxygenase-like cupin family protein
VKQIDNRIVPGRYTLSSWKDLEAADAQAYLENKIIALDRLTVVRCVYRPGSDFAIHSHPQEQITIVEEGALRFRIADEDIVVLTGQMISIPAGVKHSTAVEGEEAARALNLFVRFDRVGPAR